MLTTPQDRRIAELEARVAAMQAKLDRMQAMVEEMTKPGPGIDRALEQAGLAEPTVAAVRVATKQVLKLPPFPPMATSRD